MELSRTRGVPIGNGIVTVDNEAQAWERALMEKGDKGRRCRARVAGAGAAQAPVERTRSAHGGRSPPSGPQGQSAWRCQRLPAVQALYQMDIAATGLTTSSPSSKAIGSAGRSRASSICRPRPAFFRDIVSGVVREQRKLDPLIDDALAKTWPLKRIEAILRAVLRAGAYELDHRRDVPARVVLSEYVDIAHAFVERDETGMVNAVLDQIARKLRTAEFTAR